MHPAIGLLLLLATVAAMEGVAHAAHRWVMHGPGSCTTHCPAEGIGIAVSAEKIGGSASEYYGPLPPTRNGTPSSPPGDLTSSHP